ncbi:hypothetical protein O3G_MSEX012203 [Manduca sexta]|uniref:CUE domain-containing protein n=1 Tax=Manduca sexta TaxID=7130 RepID=A0A921ZMJ7_MANSE|nr:hypothetical protein O3G_MSEX012203 [Manduca sexta]
MFPQYSLSVLAADLTLTRSADLTLENILEGRLQPNTTDLPAEPTGTADRPVEETARPSPSRATASASSASIAGTSSATDTNTSTRSRSDDDK